MRSRNVGTQIGAGFKSLVGGELKGTHEAAHGDSRAGKRAHVRGGSKRWAGTPCIAMRFDSDEIAQGYQELVAYGTAVRVTKL